MNRLYALFFIGCLSLSGLVFSFWSEPAQPTGSRTLVDFAGRTVHLKSEQPKRIISLSPSNTEILYALELGDRLMAVSEYSDYPPEAKQKPRIGGFQSPDIEQIISLHPDIVFAGSLHTRAVAALTAAGVPVAVVEPKTMQEVLDAVKLVGVITGEQDVSERVTVNLAAQLQTIRDLVSKQPKQRVFLEVWDEPFMTIGAKSYLSDIVAQAGGINVAGDKPTDYMTSDFEYLYSLDPDIYIAVNHIGLGRTLKMSNHPWMQNLRAVKTGQVHYVPDDILSRPGPRSFEGLVVLAKILHPEIMKSWAN
ncbi:ABC transporter substrate-binding protein [Anaerosporomusa subterranea]|uniref:ABC transporter substrate-binding protein n=1 Tax=Anaerosporomusa subterranea TaxID=1794912 RepID=UPI0009EEBD82|nr:cobalamin-binding protein [Anaerosporomusa subterranea]